MRIRVRSILTIGFGIVVGLFALATLVTIGSVGRVRRLEADLARLDHAKHEGHLTLSAVQKAFMHESRMLIRGQASDMAEYREALEAARSRVERLDEAARSVGVADGADDIRLTFEELERYFAGVVLPALGESDTETIMHHNHLAALTERAGKLNRDLNSVLEGRAAEVRGELENVLRLTQAATVTMLSLSVLVAIGVAVALVRYIARPVAELHRASNAVGAGAMDVHVNAGGPTELAELASGFNDMVKALRESRRLIAEQERRAAIGELAAGIAHELNNPLGVIRGYLKVLRKEVDGEQPNRDIDIITDEVDQCQLIVQGLLELARPQVIEKQPTEVVSLLREVLERQDTARGAESPAISFTPAAPSIEAPVDGQALKRVLVNLINNAADAAGPDGEVDISLEESEGRLTISVSDSGSGIPPDIRDDLFRPFRTTKPDGTGLGLAISDALVRAHGGSIEVADGAKGGALFRVVIPMTSSAGDQT
jgi:signal transduction histidine kinase